MTGTAWPLIHADDALIINHCRQCSVFRKCQPAPDNFMRYGEIDLQPLFINADQYPGFYFQMNIIRLQFLFHKVALTKPKYTQLKYGEYPNLRKRYSFNGNPSARLGLKMEYSKTPQFSLWLSVFIPKIEYLAANYKFSL